MKRILLILVMVWMVADTVLANEPISEDAKVLAIMNIKEYERIVDASIYQKGKIVKLTLLVDYGTSEQYARRMGDNFLRMLKNYSPDTSPTNRIGPGIYDYYIGVAMPSRTMLGEGIKLGISYDLKWL